MNNRKPDVDVIGIWKGFGYEGRNNAWWDSKCRVRIWKGDQCRPTVVVMSDLDEDNSGTSITNSSEHIATKIAREFNLPDSTIWFEHYSRCNHSEQQQRFSGIKEEISQVTYTVLNGKYSDPKWVYIKKELAKDMIKASLDMEGYKCLPKHRFN